MTDARTELSITTSPYRDMHKHREALDDTAFTDFIFAHEGQSHSRFYGNTESHKPFATRQEAEETIEEYGVKSEKVFLYLCLDIVEEMESLEIRYKDSSARIEVRDNQVRREDEQAARRRRQN